MRNVNIHVIKHDDQRYETVGDWVFDGDGLSIYVSDLGDWRYNMVVAVHELVEVILCHDRGISQESVDAFDIEFENNRKEGNTDEPGDDPKAPYRDEHCFATAVERMLIAALGLSWKDYESKMP